MASILDFLQGGKNKINEAKNKISQGVNWIFEKGEVAGGVVLDIITNPLEDTQRGLSEEEVTGLQEIFGDSIRWDEVVINDSSLMADINSNFNESGNSRPFVLGATINSDGPISERELVHEMMHVYQFNKYGWEYLLMVANNNSYDYEYSTLETIANDNTLAGRRLEQFGLEQQGEIVADYYELTQFKPGDTVTLRDGTVVSEANIDDLMDTYEPYIQEIQETTPREGVHKEIDELGEELIQETGEAGQEIFEEIKEGDLPGTAYEIGEAGVELAWETGEGTIEITREAGEDIIDWTGDRAEEVADWTGDRAEDVADWGSDRIGDAVDLGDDVIDGTIDKIKFWD